MKKNNTKIIFLTTIFLGIFGLASSSRALTLPWSCGFEGGSLSSCGLSSENSSNTDFTSSSASHTGTYGYRVTVNSGDNNSLGGFYADSLASPTNPSDVYVRWYMRVPSSISFANFYKLIYFHTSNYTCLDFSEGNLVLETANFNASINWGIGDIMAGCTHGGYASCYGDSQWHEYELHIKNNGFFEMWTDGVYRGSATNSQPDTDLNGLLEFMVNGHGVVGSGGVDWDDMAISTTGPIGPLGGSSDTTPPAAPSGLSVS